MKTTIEWGVWSQGWIKTQFLEGPMRFPYHLNVGDTFTISFDKAGLMHPDIEFQPAKPLTFNNWDDIYTAIWNNEAKITSKHTINDVTNALDIINNKFFPFTMKPGDSLNIVGLGLGEFTIAQHRTFVSMFDLRSFLKHADGVPAIGLFVDGNPEYETAHGAPRCADCLSRRRLADGRGGHPAVRDRAGDQEAPTFAWRAYAKPSAQR